MTLELAKKLVSENPKLRDAQVIDVSTEISDFVVELIRSEWDWCVRQGLESLNVPSSSRLPCDPTILCFVGEAVQRPIFLADVDGGVAFGDLADGKPMGAWYPEDGTCFLEDEISHPHGENFATNLLFLCAFTCALLNEPRVVRQSPAIPRQQRRAIQRGMDFSVEAWTRVSWDLSKETVAKVSSDPSFHKMPLHWCRGHYRRAEQHYAGAIQRPDAFRPEDRDLWWQWIEGVWKGHPAFGVKRSVHAPVMSAGKLASRGMAA